jgi:hypothetical protein
MKISAQSRSKWTLILVGTVTSAVLGLSCGSGTQSTADGAKTLPIFEQSAAQAACSAPLFNMGRPIGGTALANAASMKFGLREVHFRNVIARSPDDVELAYRVEMRMELSADRFLVPVHSLPCNVENHPSRRAKKLSRTMIPVLGDLHLPSARITVYDESSAESDLYNNPRISEITVSSAGYFSFNQNWQPYRKVRTVSDYMNLLRHRSFFSRVELREMGDGWLGIYAEKNIGGETAQLLILLSNSSPN